MLLIFSRERLLTMGEFINYSKPTFQWFVDAEIANVSCEAVHCPFAFRVREFNYSFVKWFLFSGRQFL